MKPQMVVRQHGSLCWARGVRRSVVSDGSTVSLGSNRQRAKRHTNILAQGVGVFQDYYQQEMLKDYSSSTIAWIPSLQIFFMMASVSYRRLLHWSTIYQNHY